MCVCVCVCVFQSVFTTKAEENETTALVLGGKAGKVKDQIFAAFGSIIVGIKKKV